MAVGIHPKGDAPLYTFKQPPSETEWMLCVELYEASDLPFEKDPRVVISVGPNEVATTHRVETEGPASRRAQWYQIAYMKLNYPDDPAQLPDIFVNLYKGDDRTSYERFSPRSITRFKDMYPEWVHLKCDPFGSLGKQDYPGTLFMSIGLGRKSEWDELVRSGGASQAFQDRETARQGKEDTDAAQRKGDMLLSEERLQLARFIVTRHDRELKDLFLKPPPKGGEGREKQRKYNMFWLDNIEMIMNQMDPPPPRDLLEKMKGAFKEAKDRKQPHNNKQEPASNWVDKANSDVKGTEWARLDGLQAQVEKATGTTGGEAGDAAPRIDKDTFIFIGDYERVWDDESAKAREDGSIWRPKCDRKNYAVCGDVASDDRNKPLGSTLAVRTDSKDVAKPCEGFTRVWKSKRGGDDKRAMKKPKQRSKLRSNQQIDLTALAPVAY